MQSKPRNDQLFGATDGCLLCTLQSLEIKDRHVHCYYVRTLYKTIAIRAAFVIYAWHLVAWHLEQQPNIHVDLMDRSVGKVFLFLWPKIKISLPPSFKWSSKWCEIEDKIYILTKNRSWKRIWNAHSCSVHYGETLEPGRLKHTVASLWSSSQIAAEL